MYLGAPSATRSDLFTAKLTRPLVGYTYGKRCVSAELGPAELTRRANSASENWSARFRLGEARTVFADR